MDPEINDFTLGPNNNPAEFRLRSKLETDVLTCEFCGFSSKTRANHNVHLSTCKQKKILYSFPDLRKYGKWHRGSFCQLCFNEFCFSPPIKTCRLASFHRKLPFPDLRKIWEIALCLHLLITI